jgi:hypothetical protein
MAAFAGQTRMQANKRKWRNVVIEGYPTVPAILPVTAIALQALAASVWIRIGMAVGTLLSRFAVVRRCMALLATQLLVRAFQLKAAVKGM